MRFTIQAERWPLRRPFTISRETISDLPLVYLRIEAEGAAGHAEAAGVDYRGETPATMAAAIADYLTGRAVPPERDQLLRDLPPGGARNAIDCALWDWEAKRGRGSVAERARLVPLRALETVYTIGLDAPQVMAEQAGQAMTAFLKLKLGGRDGRDVERVGAVRAAAPKARLLVDVNEGWSPKELGAYAPALLPFGVELIEQPVPAAEDAAIADWTGPIPLCADESFDDLAALDRLAGYSAINIKLDKCGGLTAALAIVAAAKRRGLNLFVGSMLGTSLGMAPAFLIGQSCRYVDLDGPLLLSADRDAAMRYEGFTVAPPDPALWG